MRPCIRIIVSKKENIYCKMSFPVKQCEEYQCGHDFCYICLYYVVVLFGIDLTPYIVSPRQSFFPVPKSLVQHVVWARSEVSAGVYAFLVPVEPISAGSPCRGWLAYRVNIGVDACPIARCSTASENTTSVRVHNTSQSLTVR